jgi:hypothetical protein
MPRKGVVRECARRIGPAASVRRLSERLALPAGRLRLMLTVQQVEELVHGAGLSDHLEQIVKVIRPGWRLEPAGDGAAVRLGGDPRLAPDEGWPHNPRGVPLAYLAEIDAARLPPVPAPWDLRLDWPHQGRVLRVFANVLDNPNGPTVATVLSVDHERPLTKTPHPDLPDPLPAGGPWSDTLLEDRYWRLDEHDLTAVPFVTLPECLPGLRDHVSDFSPLAERYVELCERVRTDGHIPSREPGRLSWGVHHLLGHPSSLQDDTRMSATLIYGEPSFAEVEGVTIDPALGEPDAWRVLLALYSDGRLGLTIHDAGAWHVLIPEVALTSGRYDQAVCDAAGG